MLNMRPILNQGALFSDGSPSYRFPSEPEAGDTLTIRFRTQKNNVDRVFFLWETDEDGEERRGTHRQEMKLAGARHTFDYYETQVEMPAGVLRYHFEILYGWSTYYYNGFGVSKEDEPRLDFEVYPGFHVPDWAKGAVMYQIFVDRFYNGDPTNDVLTGEYAYIEDQTVKPERWDQFPAAVDIREFYGGDLQGVMNKLDYLQELGVEVIYLNPVFVSPSNHKYDCQDYDYIDPHFGRIVVDEEGLLEAGDLDNTHAAKYIRRVTDHRNLEAGNELFARLTEEIHRRGMKIILDGVFNHCGSFNKWMDRERIYEGREGYPDGAFISADSPYRSYFQFSRDEWPCNTHYDGWWGHETLPKLNYEASPELCRHIMEIGRKWVSPPYNVDGWRLDVAADLGYTNEFNHNFWKEFRKAVKEANPNAVILAEHYGNAEKWLYGDEWDTVMNYDAFMEPLTWFLTGMEKHSDEYRADLYGNSEAFIFSMKLNMRTLHMGSLYAAMNELSNHDHSRFLTRTNRKVGRVTYVSPETASSGVNPAVMREAVAVQMTWPGSPTVYYGDEAGVCGYTDPDNRRTYPWGREDLQMIDFHREMIRVRKNCKVLKNGSLEYIWNDYQGLSFGRFDEKEQVIVTINNQEEPREVELDVWKTGISRHDDTILERIMFSDKDSFSTERVCITARNGRVRFCIPSFGVIILYHSEQQA